MAMSSERACGAGIHSKDSRSDKSRSKLVRRAGTLGLALTLASCAAIPATAVITQDAFADETALAAQAAYTNTFTFSDSAVVASEDAGYKIEGTSLTINAPGTYLITGSCSEGSITVKKGTTGVTLVLQDLNLSCSETAPLAINKNNGDTTIQVEGTVTLTDKEDAANETSTDETVADAFEGAAIKVKNGSNLTICGSGTLNADGTACKNAIKGGEAVAITVDGSLTVNAKAASNGISSDGSVTISSGTVNVNAGNDGIESCPDEGDTSSAGIVNITGGTVNVTASDDGIKADPDATSSAASSGGTTNITGGTITVNAADGGIKAYNDLNIGTKGSSSGPTVNVQQATEGIEAATVNFYSGSGSIVASDDGVNAANKDISENENAELFNLNIYGGTWTVNSQGDGLDSNGNISISGGSTIVYGPTSGGNGVFDVADNGGSFSVTGGSLLGLGTSDMAVTPTSGTYVVFGGSAMGGGMGGFPGGQPGGMNGGMRPMSENGESTATDDAELSAQAFGGSNLNISAGQTVSVKDSSGNTLASTTAAKNAQWVLYASGDLESGQTYTLSSNNSQLASASATSGANANTNPSAYPGSNTAPGSNVNNGSVPNAGAPSGNPSESSASWEKDKSSSQQVDTSNVSAQDMFRLYNPNSGEHFYTSDYNERQTLIEAGWNYEGIGWNAPSASNTPVYRFYNPNAGEHHYTTDSSEGDALIAAGWTYEGIGWYSDDAKTVPLYRDYNPNQFSNNHNYTTDESEHNYLVSIGWNDEGYAWYGI